MVLLRRCFNLLQRTQRVTLTQRFIDKNINSQPFTAPQITNQPGVNKRVTYQVSTYVTSAKDLPAKVVANGNTSGHSCGREKCDTEDCCKLPVEKKDGTIYELTPVDKTLMQTVRYPLLILAGLSAFTTNTVIPYTDMFGLYEYLRVILPVISIPYFIRQHYMWCNEKALKIDYSTQENKYKMDLFGLFRTKKVDFKAEDVKAPPNQLDYIRDTLAKEETRVCREKSNIMSRIKSIYREPTDPFMFSLYPETKKEIQFKLERKYMDFQNGASEAFYQKHDERTKEEGGAAGAVKNKITLDADGRTLGKLKDRYSNQNLPSQTPNTK